jgi:hypothetical protein
MLYNFSVGSMNIARKVIPNFMDGIVGLPFIPVVVGLWLAPPEPLRCFHARRAVRHASYWTKVTNVDV